MVFVLDGDSRTSYSSPISIWAYPSRGRLQMNRTRPYLVGSAATRSNSPSVEPQHIRITIQTWRSAKKDSFELVSSGRAGVQQSAALEKIESLFEPIPTRLWGEASPLFPSLSPQGIVWLQEIQKETLIQLCVRFFGKEVAENMFPVWCGMKRRTSGWRLHVTERWNDLQVRLGDEIYGKLVQKSSQRAKRFNSVWQNGKRYPILNPFFPSTAIFFTNQTSLQNNQSQTEDLRQR